MLAILKKTGSSYYHVDNVHDGGEDNHSDDPISYTRQKMVCEILTKTQKRWMAQKYRKSHERWKKYKSHRDQGMQRSSFTGSAFLSTRASIVGRRDRADS